MYTRLEAYELAKEAEAIGQAQQRIEESINNAVKAGAFNVSLDVSDYSQTVKTTIAKWLESFGYKPDIYKWEDPRSGWSRWTLKICWEKED